MTTSEPGGRLRFRGLGEGLRLRLRTVEPSGLAAQFRSQVRSSEVMLVMVAAGVGVGAGVGGAGVG